MKDLEIVYTGATGCLKWSLYENGVDSPKASSNYKKDLILIANSHYPKGTTVSVHYVNGEVDRLFTVGDMI